MNPVSQAIGAFDLVIFGGTGDLARRKLLPALLHRFADGLFGSDSRIVAIARDALPPVEYRARVREELSGMLAGDAQGQLDAFVELIDYHALDAMQDDG